MDFITVDQLVRVQLDCACESAMASRLAFYMLMVNAMYKQSLYLEWDRPQNQETYIVFQPVLPWCLLDAWCLEIMYAMKLSCPHIFWHSFREEDLESDVLGSFPLHCLTFWLFVKKNFVTIMQNGGMVLPVLVVGKSINLFPPPFQRETAWLWRLELDDCLISDSLLLSSLLAQLSFSDLGPRSNFLPTGLVLNACWHSRFCGGLLPTICVGSY